jgi:signal transduction histidine kinase
MPTKTRPTPSPAFDASLSVAEAMAKLGSVQTELNALYGEMERLNRLAAIGTIAGMIAHEFNNILTPMLTYSQMAVASPDDHALARKALQRTLAGTERAAKIADAILSFVRDEGGAEQSGHAFHVEHGGRSARAHLVTVVQDALACLARGTIGNGIDSKQNIPTALHASIQPIALQQVLVNLLLNAQNAIGSKGGGVEIAASRWMDEPATPAGAADSRTSQTGGSDARSTWNSECGTPAAWICIVVRDTGCGMSREQLDRMFTPFRTQANESRRGNGLGMVITKRLVERAGGWITVESKPGRGTSVTIVLPEALPNI